VNRGLRALAFAASATSIACLLLELYSVAPMSRTVVWLLGPGTLVVSWLAWRSAIASDVRAAALAGFVAAVAYDVFRIPFVLAGMPLFKVFPAFGASITGLAETSAVAIAAGWLYHFSNGISFGVMFVVLAGRKRWALALPWALGIEAGLLLSPYASAFGIPLSAKFVAVTVAAHAVFGIVMGLWLRRSVTRAPS
jgi:hypothetical protein